MNKNLMLERRPFASCDYHRVELPYKLSNINPKSPVYIFNRVPGMDLVVLKGMKREGVKVICDVDDFWELNPSHYIYDAWKESRFEEKITESLKIADVVTCTSPLLASKVRPYNRNVVVIPNALPYEFGQFQKSTDKESDSCFVYLGGPSHRSDLALLEGLTSDLTIAGYNSTIPEWVKIAQALPGAAFKHQAMPDEYMKLYDGHRVAVAPLIGNDFNACKSNLKMLEAGCKGIPLIASTTMPYFNPVDLKVVLYANGLLEWRSKMRLLLNNPNMADDLGAALAEHVRLHYNLDDANELRRQVVESL